MPEILRLTEIGLRFGWYTMRPEMQLKQVLSSARDVKVEVLTLDKRVANCKQVMTVNDRIMEIGKQIQIFHGTVISFGGPQNVSAQQFTYCGLFLRLNYLKEPPVMLQLQNDESETTAAAITVVDDPNSVFDCVICLNIIRDAYVTECGHTFCGDCLKEWIQVPDTLDENQRNKRKRDNEDYFENFEGDPVNTRALVVNMVKLDYVDEKLRDYDDENDEVSDYFNNDEVGSESDVESFDDQVPEYTEEVPAFAIKISKKDEIKVISLHDLWTVDQTINNLVLLSKNIPDNTEGAYSEYKSQYAYTITLAYEEGAGAGPSKRLKPNSGPSGPSFIDLT
eukprot:gene1618-2259_t